MPVVVSCRSRWWCLRRVARCRSRRGRWVMLGVRCGGVCGLLVRRGCRLRLTGMCWRGCVRRMTSGMRCVSRSLWMGLWCRVLVASCVRIRCWLICGRWRRRWLIGSRFTVSPQVRVHNSVTRRSGARFPAQWADG